MTSCNQCGDIIHKSVEVCENCGNHNVSSDRNSMLGVVAVLVPLVALIFALKIIIN